MNSFPMCVRRNLKDHVGKSKLMVFEKRNRKVIKFSDQYRMRVESQEHC